jgi:hypothetical protein
MDCLSWGCLVVHLRVRWVSLRALTARPPAHHIDFHNTLHHAQTIKFGCVGCLLLDEMPSMK